MRFAVELSGEHPRLPEAEVEALTGAEAVERDRRLLLVDAPPDVPWHRLGLSHAVGRHLGSAPDLADLVAQATSWSEVPDPFAVRVHAMADGWSADRIARRLGKALGTDRTVDLQDPAGVVRVVGADRLHAHLLVHDIDRSAMEARRSHMRPFDHPTSLHPRLARALVNLAQPEAGLLDPFCGTGGILLEAGLMGIRSVGVDVSRTLADGARTNLAHFGAAGSVVHGDARRLPVGRGVDAVATDLPYGRSTRTGGRSPEQLLTEVAERLGDVLAPGDRIVAVLPTEPATPPGLERLDAFRIRVHRSLTRHVQAYVIL